MKWKIGCSGFYYKEWKDFFYPKGLAQKDWFKFYAEHFNTIEINASFYKNPTEKSLEKWHNDSPADFVFTMKAPRLITHYKQLKDCKTDTTDFYHLLNIPTQFFFLIIIIMVGSLVAVFISIGFNYITARRISLIFDLVFGLFQGVL